MSVINTSLLGRFLGKVRTLIRKERSTFYTAASDDGVTYTVEVPDVTELYAGLKIYVKFGRNSATTTPKLNVNNLGAKYIRQPLTTNNTATVAGATTTWLTTACPVVLTYTGSMWKTDIPRADAANLYGTTAIEHGGTGASTAAAALTNLGAASVTYVDEQIAALRAELGL